MGVIDVRLLDDSRPSKGGAVGSRHGPLANGARRAAQAGSADSPKARYRAISERHLNRIPQLSGVADDARFAMQVVSRVLPFRTNRYVIDNLIDWSRVPDDPIYQMIFPQPGMLDGKDFDRVADLVRRDAPAEEFAPLVASIRAGLNPHPAGQRELNIPNDDAGILEGIQHKYRETVLFFPSRGQTCHAYCTFCFRWAQFVGKDMKIYAKHADGLHRHLASHPEVTDLLITGGDPMVMNASALSRYLMPILESPETAHVQNIRIGTKSLTFWPYRFVTDPDADELLRLLEQVVKSGRHLAIMAHFNHWRELSTDVVREAIRRLRDAGAVIRAQAPLLARINDDPAVWRRMWQDEVRLGVVPYYMFVERDTGARRYFEVPLERARRIYADALSKVSGLARTVRGPSMSADPGKVEILGVQEIRGERVFVLRFLQGRNPDWVGVPFFATFDPEATWLDQLKPAFGEQRFFYEDEFESMRQRHIGADVP